MLESLSVVREELSDGEHRIRLGDLRVPEPDGFIFGWVRQREIKKRGSHLLYRTSELISPVPDRKILRGEVLMGFTKLENASDEEIIEYARRWGVLGLCIHGRPYNHLITQRQEDGEPLPTGEPARFFVEDGCGLPWGGALGWGKESFAQWRDYAGQVGAILKLSAICRTEMPTPVEQRKSSEYTKEKPGNPEDWEKAMRDWREDNSYDPSSTEPVWTGKWTLQLIISHWMRVNNIRPVFVWNKDAPSIRLIGNAFRWEYLLPVLAIQMMLVACNSVDLGLCAGCSEPFLLSRGQSLHRNSYCLDCRRRQVPQQRARQKFYHNERKSPNRKKRSALTKRQVASVKRALQRKNPVMVKELAEKYNVSKWTIYKIAEGKSWGSTK
jgi:hypothetical protein